MAALEPIVDCRFSEAYLSYQDSGISGDTLVFDDGVRRIPSNYFDVSRMSATGKEPYVAALPDVTYGVVTQGLHDYAKSGGGNNTGSVLRYLGTLPSAKERCIAWAVVRVTDAHDHIQVGPAVRITDGSSSDALGKKCYSLELHWDSGSSVWRLIFFRYDDFDGVETGNPFSESVSGTKTQIGTGLAISNFTGHRLYALGLQSSVSGSQVNLYAYHYLLASGPVFAPGLGTISALVGNYPYTHSAADSSGSRLVGTDHTGFGVKWRYRTSALTAPIAQRTVVEFGLSYDAAATKPSTPSITDRIFERDGTKVTLYSSAFSDSDTLDTHVKSRWLLYERVAGAAENSFPVRDSGFVTSLREYAFEDLAPGKAYAARVQYLDSDGDVSPLSATYSFQANSDDLPHGIIAVLDGYDHPAHFGPHRNDAFDYFFDDAPTAEPVLLQRHDGEAATSYGPYLTKREDLASWTRLYRHVAFTSTPLLTGGPDPVYGSILATTAFLQWGDAPNVALCVRSSATDSKMYFVTKADAGISWSFFVFRRALKPNKVFTSSNVNDWINTPLFTGTILKSRLGINGERVILASYDVSGTKTLALYVNGIFLGSVTGNDASQGFGDAGHEHSALLLGRVGSSTTRIQQLGQLRLLSSFRPELPITVYPSSRSTGAKMHNPGPYMDPFDSGTDVGGVENVWFQSGSKFRFRTGAAVDAATGMGFLIYWSPFVSTPDYSVSAAFYNGCGPVARFSGVETHIRAYVSMWTDAGLPTETRKLIVKVVENGSDYSVFDAEASDCAEGDEIALHVVNDPETEGRIYIRLFYAGELIALTKVSGQGTGGETATVDVSSTSELLDGRFGVYRSPHSDGVVYNLAASSIAVCGPVTCAETEQLNPPSAPTVSEPTDVSAVKVSARLHGSTFLDTDLGAVHSGTQWQVFDVVGDQLIFDSGDDASNLTGINVTPGVGTWTPLPGDTAGLNPLTAYKYRARYKDQIGLWSEWSDYEFFTTVAPDVDTPVLDGVATYPEDPQPSQVYVETIAFNNLVTVFETGKEQRRAKWTRGRIAFRLRYEKITSEQMDVLWTFFNETAFGRLNLFYVRHPRTLATYHVCRFLEDSMSRENFEYLIEGTGITLVEVPV